MTDQPRSEGGHLTDVTAGTTVALRCSEEPGEDITVFHAAITALQVTTVTRP